MHTKSILFWGIDQICQIPFANVKLGSLTYFLCWKIKFECYEMCFCDQRVCKMGHTMTVFLKHLFTAFLHCLFGSLFCCFTSQSTAVVITRRSVHLTTLFPGQFLHCLLVLLLYVPVNSYGHYETVSSPNHTFSWASLNKRLTSTSCTYFRL